MANAPRIGFFVHHHFLKDLSFENPVGPISPEVASGIAVSVGGNVLNQAAEPDGRYVVETTLTITGREAERVRFVCELTYVAEVELSHIPEPVREQILCVDVPQHLVQHINAVVDHAGRAGGLPGLTVERINFLDLYRKEKARRRAAAAH